MKGSLRLHLFVSVYIRCFAIAIFCCRTFVGDYGDGEA